MRMQWAAAMVVVTAIGSAQTPGARTYANPELQLTFSYPAELHPQAVAASPQGSNSCSQTLLVAAMGTDPNLPQEGGQTEGTAHWARLTLSEAGCLPEKILKKEKEVDAMLAGMAGDATETLGLMPLEQPFGYLLEEHHVFLATAQGAPVMSSAVQPANGQEVVAVIATVIKGRILNWRMESNDPELFNRMLASHVDFGAGTPQALYPGHIGSE